MAPVPDPNATPAAATPQPVPQQDPATQLAPGFTPLDAEHLKAAGPDPVRTDTVRPATQSALSANALAPGFTPLSPEHEDAIRREDAGHVPAASTPDKQGILSKAWDWVVKTPVLDNVLPKGITTSDLVRGAAFEKMFNEPYIPGVNDFDTKAQQHLGDSPTKAAVKTFIAGTAKDTSDFGAAATTPLGVATIGAGVLGKVPGAVGTIAKAAQGVGSAVYAGQGAHDVVTSRPDIHYEGITDRPETLGFSANPDEAQKLIGGLAGVTGGVAGVHDAIPEGTGRWTVNKLNKAIGKTDDYVAAAKRMMKITPGASEEAKTILKATQDDMSAILNADTKKQLNSPTKIAAKIDDQIQSHTDRLMKKAGETKDSTDPVVSDLDTRLQTMMDEFVDKNKGRYTPEDMQSARGKIMNEVMQLDGGDEPERMPNLFEADNVRRGFNDRSQTQMGAPRNAYQAMANDAQKVMRQAIDESFKAKGIDGVKEVREKDASLIDLRDMLLDSQGKFEAAGQGGVLRNLFYSAGPSTGMLALLLGHTAGAPIMAAGLLGDLIHHNMTNPEANLARLRTLAARNPNAVTTELEHTTPTPTGGSTPPPTAPTTGGSTPPTPPPVNHAQYAELATLKGETLDPANYPKLESDFEEYLAKKRASGKPITAEDRATLREFNKHKANNLAAQDQYKADLAAHQTAQLTAREAEIQEAIKAAQAADSTATPAPAPTASAPNLKSN